MSVQSSNRYHPHFRVLEVGARAASLAAALLSPAELATNEKVYWPPGEDSRRGQPEVMHPSLMPSAALHLAGDMLAIRRWLWRTRKCVPRVVAASACGHDVLSRVPSALALRNQVLRSAAKPLPSRAVARDFRQFVGGRQPHPNVAVVAAPTLLFKGTKTMNLDSSS